MWMPVFAVVLTIAVAFGFGAVVLESYEEKGGLFARRPGRHLRATARYLRG